MGAFAGPVQQDHGSLNLGRARGRAGCGCCNGEERVGEVFGRARGRVGWPIVLKDNQV